MFESGDCGIAFAGLLDAMQDTWMGNGGAHLECGVGMVGDPSDTGSSEGCGAEEWGRAERGGAAEVISKLGSPISLRASSASIQRIAELLHLRILFGMASQSASDTGPSKTHGRGHSRVVSASRSGLAIRSTQQWHKLTYLQPH